jgi:outer membrane protein assembly factor BamA
LKNSHHSSLRPSILSAPLGCFAFSALFLIALSWCGATRALGQQQPQAKTIRLSSIEVTGLQSVTKEQAVALSGLQVGQQIDTTMLDAAAQKLVNSGLFTNISYRLRGKPEQAIVTFEVEELKGRGLPVVFDNFVWFNEGELIDAVRREVPNFDGTALESSTVLGVITKALQQLLVERKIEGQVEYTPSASAAGGNAKHIFSVKGASAKICAVRFTGAAKVDESVLVKSSKPLMGGEYSQEFVSAFAVANLIPIYREHGHLRASFDSPTAKLSADASANCKDAVTVTLPVTEGVSYQWDKAEWAGNSSFTAEELEAALAMKAGELANGLKIDAGLMAVQKTYGKKGYLRATSRTEAIYDDVNRRVIYRVQINEGPQFKMGTLKITGLPDDVALRLRHRWTLREGGVYDDTYLINYAKKEVTDVIESALRERAIPPGTKLKMDTTVKPNTQTLAVDVQLDFKNAATPPAEP